MNPHIIALAKKSTPGIPKIPVPSLTLIKDVGIQGDYHAGPYIRHRYLARKDPLRKNNRQVLLIDQTILNHLKTQNIHLTPGSMGENILLANLNLMQLPLGTTIRFHPPTSLPTNQSPAIQLTEIRKPCNQLNQSHPRLLENVIHSIPNHPPRYTAGMLAIVTQGGQIKQNFIATIQPPQENQEKTIKKE